jgi:hypothetical protein
MDDTIIKPAGNHSEPIAILREDECTSDRAFTHAENEADSEHSAKVLARRVGHERTRLHHQPICC